MFELRIREPYYRIGFFRVLKFKTEKARLEWLKENGEILVLEVK